MTDKFKTHNAKQQPLQCKFCHAHVWYNIINNRWYQPGGTEFHSPHCKLSQEYHRAEALTREESKRQSKGSEQC